MKRFLSLAVSIFLLASFARAQSAEVTIQLNEQFFDALLDAIFKSATPLEFPLAESSPKSKVQSPKSEVQFLSFISSFQDFGVTIPNPKSQIPNPACNESIRLQREIDGVRTAVRFRDGRIFAPLAFSGNYNPPLVGCVAFSGWAETNIELEFDREKQSLIGRAKVTNVGLSGTRGIGGSIITKLVQSAIDKKINPIQILQTDKVSFVVPLQNAGSLRIKAVGMRHEIINGALNVRIAYEFQKVD